MSSGLARSTDKLLVKPVMVKCSTVCHAKRVAGPLSDPPLLPILSKEVRKNLKKLTSRERIRKNLKTANSLSMSRHRWRGADPLQQSTSRRILDSSTLGLFHSSQQKQRSHAAISHRVLNSSVSISRRRWCRASVSRHGGCRHS